MIFKSKYPALFLIVGDGSLVDSLLYRNGCPHGNFIVFKEIHDWEL